MRAKPMHFLGPAVAFVAAAWLVGWFKGRELEARHEALRQSLLALPALRAEQVRLQAQLAEAGRTNRLPPPPAETVSKPAAGSRLAPSLELGEWTPSKAWRNEGRQTVRATVGTLLWAAASGDVRAWQEAMEFDDASRLKASELFAKVSPVVKSQYATAEDLVASVAMTRVPVTDAQLMWLRETDADHAIVGLRLANAGGLAAAVPVTGAAGPTPPPQLPEAGRERLVVLNLHRTATGWRVLVPAGAIERMATELKAPVAKM